jgi:hypothetical protein
MTPPLIAFIFSVSEINPLLLIAQLAQLSGAKCVEKQ